MKNLCAVISGPSRSDVQRQLAEAKDRVSLFEFRLDLMETREVSFLDRAILTVRTEEDLLFAIEKKPLYIDMPFSLWRAIPGQKTIASHHKEGPMPDLKALSCPPSDLVKVCLEAKSTLDELKLYRYRREDSRRIVLSQGSFTALTRSTLNQVQYVHLDSMNPFAKGQLSLSEAENISFKEPLFALIGDPVWPSISHIAHNRYLKERGTYMKLLVTKEQLPSFLEGIKDLPFKGLSVTTPLKELIVPYLDAIDTDAKTIGAVNSVKIEGGRLIGYNSDKDGVANLLPFEGKRVKIVGAGGFARACAFAVKQGGGSFTVINRKPEKARSLICAFGGDPSQDLPFDILINAAKAPLSPSLITSGITVLEASFAYMESKALKKAKALGCKIVSAEDLFYAQAKEQFRFFGY